VVSWGWNWSYEGSLAKVGWLVGLVEVMVVWGIVLRLSSGWEGDLGPGFMHRVEWHEVLQVFCAGFILFALVGQA
jgi:hypothetical protein